MQKHYYKTKQYLKRICKSYNYNTRNITIILIRL